MRESRKAEREISALLKCGFFDDENVAACVVREREEVDLNKARHEGREWFGLVTKATPERGSALGCHGGQAGSELDVDASESFCDW